MSRRPVHRRRRSLSIAPKHVVLALFVIAVFVFVVTMLGQANRAG